MRFEIMGEITRVATIAVGIGVRIRALLRKAYGPGRWRKMKGVAVIRFRSGDSHVVELHWYEAHGIGRRDFKIKRFLYLQ
ncbi:MAG: hypothetical protein P3A28_03005 [Gemmatimonadota bacterium]|nr:hypothetical protein [Gemmatimonadota bacterium]